MNHKVFPFLFLISLIIMSPALFSQTIKGKVIDASTDETLKYVNIGVINTSIGVITDENGVFNLALEGVSKNSQIRFSNIGYQSQTFSIEELTASEIFIKLQSETIMLPEVTINPKGKLKMVGTKGASFGEVCGWGGTQFGQGNEIGINLDLGPNLVSLQTLHIKLYKQTFDSSLFRLHIRDVVDSLPDIELLNSEIFISVTEKSGWIEVDLRPYHLEFKGQIALSLEWIKVDGLNKDRLIRVNRSKNATANVLFHIKRRQGTLFNRWGSENQWKRVDDKSPTFYLTVQEFD